MTDKKLTALQFPHHFGFI